MGINFIVVLPRTMEDPDVITRAQLALAICGRNCRTGKHVGKKEQPRAVEEVGNIGIYLYSGSYVLHTLYSAARVIMANFLDRRQPPEKYAKNTFHRNRCYRPTITC